jgi:hypothetical protein
MTKFQTTLFAGGTEKCCHKHEDQAESLLQQEESKTDG